MLVLSRRLDDTVVIFPRADFAARLVELLRETCPNVSVDSLNEIGEAILQNRKHPLFRMLISVVRLETHRREVRLGLDADQAWCILRAECEGFDELPQVKAG